MFTWHTSGRFMTHRFVATYLLRTFCARSWPLRNIGNTTWHRRRAVWNGSGCRFLWYEELYFIIVTVNRNQSWPWAYLGGGFWIQTPQNTYSPVKKDKNCIQIPLKRTYTPPKSNPQFLLLHPWWRWFLSLLGLINDWLIDWLYCFIQQFSFSLKVFNLVQVLFPEVVMQFQWSSIVG